MRLVNRCNGRRAPYYTGEKNNKSGSFFNVLFKVIGWFCFCIILFYISNMYLVFHANQTTFVIIGRVLLTKKVQKSRTCLPLFPTVDKVHKEVDLSKNGLWNFKKQDQHQNRDVLGFRERSLMYIQCWSVYSWRSDLKSETVSLNLRRSSLCRILHKGGCGCSHTKFS